MCSHREGYEIFNISHDAIIYIVLANYSENLSRTAVVISDFVYENI